MNTDLISFDKLRARILEHGIREMQMSEDRTSIIFILMNGEVYDLYTTEDDLCNQSEMHVYQKVEP